MIVDWVSYGFWIDGTYVTVRDVHVLEPADPDDQD